LKVHRPLHSLPYKLHRCLHLLRAFKLPRVLLLLRLHLRRRQLVHFVRLLPSILSYALR
jgi:hypothetical protein